MSIAEQIVALSTDKTAIKNAILNKGGALSDSDGFDDFAFAIETIPTGGGQSELQSHLITFRLADNSIININVNYDDPLISTMITSYIPETYNNKNVLVGVLDGVAWFDLSSIPFNTELIDYTKAKYGIMVNTSSGQEYQDNTTVSSCCSDFTPIVPDMAFTLMAYHWYSSVFYDENKQCIGNINIHNNGTPIADGSEFWNVRLDSTNIPENAAYIRINTYLQPNADHMSLIRIA